MLAFTRGAWSEDYGILRFEKKHDYYTLSSYCYKNLTSCWLGSFDSRSKNSIHSSLNEPECGIEFYGPYKNIILSFNFFNTT